MDSLALIFFNIIINVHVIRSQVYMNDGDIGTADFGLNPRDFAKINEADIRLLLKAIDKQRDAPQIHDTSKYCRSFVSCRECVKSMWYPCDWCHDYGCTDKSNQLCRVSSNDISQNPKNLSTCPYIYSKTPILVPSGVMKQIEVKISVPDPALLQNDLICQVKLKHRMTHVKGVIGNNGVYCYPVQLTVTDGSEVGFFSVLWGGVQPLSNEIPMLVYDCGAMANDCEDCKLLPKEYECGWCEETQICSLPDKCNDLLNWSINRMTCQYNRQMYFV